MAHEVRISRSPADRRRDLASDQRDADADQTAADADQTSSDVDQTASERDDDDAAKDQRSADRDQASADAHQVDRPGDDRRTYELTRAQRKASRRDRVATHLRRGDSASTRGAAAATRDRTGAARDATAARRGARAGGDAEAERRSPQELILLAELDRLRHRAAMDRWRAAANRERAAHDRAVFAAEHERLERALASAHVDDLTGALRRDPGWEALTLEMARARRGDGRFVLAFVDVDGLKAVNDEDGHPAGDRILTTLVSTMRTSLRSFDPIVRFGGDEFVCGLGGIDLADARARFDGIDRALQAETHASISVGLAVLADGEGLDEVLARADADLLDRRRARTA